MLGLTLKRCVGVLPKFMGRTFVSSFPTITSARMFGNLSNRAVSICQQSLRSHLDSPVCYYNTLIGNNSISLHLHRGNSLTGPMLIQKRKLVKYSKKGKHKTVKAVAKRFYRTGSGKLKYWPAGHNHKMLSKSFNLRRNLRKPKYANKQQLKVLNQMISGW